MKPIPPQQQKETGMTALHGVGEQARVERERDEARAERDAAQWALEALKVTIGVVGKRYAEEHDWCSVARRAVEDMGGKWPNDERKFEFTIRAEYKVRAVAVSTSNINKDFIWDSISNSDELEEYGPAMDSDWIEDSEEVLSVDVTIVNMEEVTDE